MPSTSDSSAPVLLQLGRIAVGGANLELRVSLLAVAALGLPQRVGMYLLGRENMGRTLGHASEALAVAQDCAAKEQSLEWLTLARAAYKRRNEILHAVIGSSLDDDLRRIRMSSSLSGPVYSELPVDQTELQDLADELQTLNNEFDTTISSALIRDLPYTRLALGHPPEGE